MNAPSSPRPEQWNRVKELLLHALSLPAADREHFLLSRCGDVESQVRALLLADSKAPSFLERPEKAVESMFIAPPTSPPTPSPTTAAPEPVQMPQTVGSCKLISLLGEGASSLVYLAEQSRPRRKVAVKILRPGQTSPTALRRIEREAEIMAQLRHPGIAHIVEAGVGHVGAFFVMEYVQGVPITHHARRHTLSVHDRLHLFLKVCDAVQHAHAMGIIHRDLKPANILVTAAGEPKVLDFGVARAVDTEGRQPTIATSLGQLVGTLAYMSPEQAAGDVEAIDTRADVYALGVILYEFLADHPPLNVSEKPLHEALRLIQYVTPPKLGSCGRAFRGDLETIAGKALEKDPDRRYASVSELAGDIRRHLQRLPIHAHPPSATYEIIRFTSRHRPLVAGFAIAAGSIIGALGWALLNHHREHQDYLIARSVAGSWLADVMNDLEPVSGTLDPRRQLLEQIRDPLEQFAQRHPEDLDVRGNLAALEFATGEVEREIGNLGSAKKRYEIAFVTLSEISAARPKREEWRLQQSIAAVKVGDVLRAREQLDEAIVWYETALKLDLAAKKDFPNSYTARDQLVWSYDRLTNMASIQNRRRDAESLCDKLVQAADDVWRRWPNKPQAIWCRIGALHMQAHIMAMADRDNETESIRAAALELSRELVRRQPNKREYVTRHIFALSHQASRKLGRNDVFTAESLLTEARPLVDRVLMMDGHERAAHDAAVTYYSCLAHVRRVKGDDGQALVAMRSNIAHARKSAQIDPYSTEAVLQSLRLQRDFITQLNAVRRPAEAADVARVLRDDLFASIERFPSSPEPIQLLTELQASLPNLFPAPGAVESSPEPSRQ